MSNQSGLAQTSSTQQWWLGLHDPLLNSIIQTALTENLTLQQAKERIIYARGLQKQQRASEKPQINLYAGPNNLARALTTNSAGSGVNQPQSVSSGAYLAGFDLFWELPIFGLGPGQRQVTQAELQTAQFDLSLKQVSLISEIVRVYAELSAAVQREQQLEVIEKSYSDLKTVSAKGIDKGLVAPDELESLSDGERSIQRLLRQNRITQEISLQRLAVLSGKNEPSAQLLAELQSRQSKLALTDAEKSLALPLMLPANIIRERPDIKLAEAQVLKATGALGIAKSDLYPKLTIEGALMAAGRISAEMLRHTGSVTYIAPSIRIPLLDWGLRRQVVNQRESQLREALLAYKEAVLLAIEETENAIVTFNENRAQLLADDIEQARRQGQLTKLQRAVEAGYLSKVDIFKQDIRNQQASLQYIDAKLAWVQGFSHANKALSGMVSASAEQ